MPSPSIHPSIHDTGGVFSSSAAQGAENQATIDMRVSMCACACACALLVIYAARVMVICAARVMVLCAARVEESVEQALHVVRACVISTFARGIYLLLRTHVLTHTHTHTHTQARLE